MDVLNYSLTEGEYEKRKERYGENKINFENKATPFKIFLRQFNNLMVYILLISIILSLILNHMYHAIIIGIIIFLIVVLGFFQEYKASKEMDALKNLLVPDSVVVRAKKKKVVPSLDVVPGDLVYLTTGDKVPADGVILESNNFSVDESIITGESEPQLKKAIEANGKSEFGMNNYDGNEKVFMSTYVNTGNAYVKILKTGGKTEFGKIAGMVQGDEDSLDDLVDKPLKYLTSFAISLVFVSSLILFFREGDINNVESILQILVMALAMLVAGIPEGLPLVVTLSLAKGVKKMSEKNVIVNKMSSLESLGKVSFICSDKTGTITKNQMTVKKFFYNDKSYDVEGIGYNNKGEILQGVKKVDQNDIDLFLDSLILCNDSSLSDISDKEETPNDRLTYKIVGSSTEGSLLVLGEKASKNKDELQKKHPRHEEVPFSSDRKMMSTLNEYSLNNKLTSISYDLGLKDKDNDLKNEKTLFVKGAVDVILPHCKRVVKHDKITMFDKRYKNKIINNVEKLSENGYRVLGIAIREGDSERDIEHLEKDNLIFLGYVAIIDPARDDVNESIKVANDAGIDVMMITGDHKKTAVSIANSVGLIDKSKGNYRVMTGDELDETSDDDLSKIIEDVRVFARMKPEQKLRVIDALKVNNHVVAMTGDGVNDAPALKKSDIGISLGSGTEVARESSDIVLKDDKFSTIVTGIKEGRHIFENLQKFSSFLFSCNLTELLAIFVTILFNLPIAFTALQVLLINLIIDDMPAIALALNPESDDIMEWKPKDRDEPLFDKKLTKLTIFTSILMTSLILSLFIWSINSGNTLLESRGIIFTAMSVVGVMFAFSFRSFRKILKIGLSRNMFMVYASLISLFVWAFVTFGPINNVFELSAITLTTMGFILVASFFGVFVLDIVKYNVMKGFYD
ncbi:MAG: cation-translocating P-type ATPase [Candidatus Woesearchaeota archaeon]